MNMEAKFQQFTASFRGVNWNNPGSWPIVVKVTIWLAVFVVVIGAGYTLFVTELNNQLATEQKKQEALLKDYEEKAFKAMNLDAYKKQLADMEEAFGALLRQLPKDTEVPSLLEDITHTGLGSGLEFTSIDLGTESRREFYAELPINIKVVGDYHGFGAFVSGIAALPRIVTLHDFTISVQATKGKSGGKKESENQNRARVLEMAITAKTYRYSDEAPAEDAGAKKAAKKGAKGKDDKSKDAKSKAGAK